MTRLLSGYYTKRMMAKSAAESMEKSKAKGKPGMLDEIYKKQVAEADEARAEMEKKYGKDAVAALDKNEKDFIEAQSAMLKAALRGPGK